MAWFVTEAGPAKRLHIDCNGCFDVLMRLLLPKGFDFGEPDPDWSRRFNGPVWVLANGPCYCRHCRSIGWMRHRS
jgi:hypothetical protein